jgi:PhnB protein
MPKECAMRWNPYLSFDGQCEAAFKFYEKCLGGKILFTMTYGASPMADQTPPDWRARIMHTTLGLGDQHLMGADAPPGQYQKPQGMTVMLAIETVEEAERIFAALAENGAVQMPLQQTFWAARFGMVVDQFGTPWLINCETAA